MLLAGLLLGIFLHLENEGNIFLRKVGLPLRLVPELWLFVVYIGPSLWSSGQSSWLQIRRPGFVRGSGTGSLSLVSTTEELLDRKVAAPV
jgi:hypothetical protein